MGRGRSLLDGEGEVGCLCVQRWGGSEEVIGGIGRRWIMRGIFELCLLCGFL